VRTMRASKVAIIQKRNRLKKHEETQIAERQRHKFRKDNRSKSINVNCREVYR
jgi:hypothetical protein